MSLKVLYKKIKHWNIWLRSYSKEGLRGLGIGTIIWSQAINEWILLEFLDVRFRDSGTGHG